MGMEIRNASSLCREIFGSLLSFLFLFFLFLPIGFYLRSCVHYSAPSLLKRGSH